MGSTPPLRIPITPVCSHASPKPKFSPIARFTLYAFWRNGNSAVIAELRKLRRVTSIFVAEVLKVQNNPALASKFFHWADKQKGFKHNFASYNAFCLLPQQKGPLTGC
ncbi:hypothetical protein SLA2020_384170 [Shorea laevis]